MRSHILTKALVRYLMAMTLPQMVGVQFARKDKNPFVNIDMHCGRRSSLLSKTDLRNFQTETGIELTKGAVLSCETLAEFEDLIEAESEKVSIDKMAKMILHLTDVLGTVWLNLEMVDDIEEISDHDFVNPAYIWPDYGTE